MVCSVLKCKNRTCADRKQGVSFHKFPLRNSRLLNVWLRNISRPGDWQPSLRSRICSDHFIQESLLKTAGRVELKDNAVPTLQISFRAKHAPDIVENIEQAPDADADEEGEPGSSTADHSYSTADHEPITPSVEVAMKEHSYFTGVALHAAPPPSGQPVLPEPLEAPADDHTYHTNVPVRQSLDDHTYNRGEAALVNPLSNATQLDDLAAKPTAAAATAVAAATAAAAVVAAAASKPTAAAAVAATASLDDEQREEACIRNFDHTYNNKKNADCVPGAATPDADPPAASQVAPQQPAANGSHSTLRKGQKRHAETPSWKELFEENQQLRSRLSASTQKTADLSNKLTEATDRIRTLQDHVRRLKKTLAEVVLESVEAIEPKSAKKLKT